MRDKRYDDAVQAFDRVLAANPRNAQARFQRAWSLAQAGREDDAIKAFSEMAQDFPELPEPHNNLALLYAKRGDLKRAEAELLAALDARPDYAIAYSNLGDVYRPPGRTGLQPGREAQSEGHPRRRCAATGTPGRRRAAPSGGARAIRQTAGQCPGGTLIIHP